MIGALTTAPSDRLLLLGGVASLLFPLLAGVLLTREANHRRRLRRRFDLARGVAPAGSLPVAPTDIWAMPTAVLTGLGRLIAGSGLLPARTIAELEQTLSSSGFRGANGLWLFIGTKIALLIGLPLLTFMTLQGAHTRPMSRVTELAIAASVGLLAPDMIVRKLREAYLARLERGLPDALDLMVICAQAGLGLESAIERVGDEIRLAHRDIARELELTSRELQMTSDSRAALIALGQRTGLESLKRVTSTLAQTLQYGTPLTAALRALSAEMRQESLTRFEERAARLPVLLTIPMVLFILPCFFLIVGGPAVIRIMQALSH